jgi:hypothetical protein
MHVASRQQRSYVRWRTDGRAADTMRLPIEPEYPGWRTATGAVYTIPFVAYVVGTLDSHNRYISGNSAHYSLVIARTGNDTMRIVELPGSRAPIPKHIADSLFDRMTARGPLKEIAKRSDIPTEQPFFTALVPDEHDNVWIERPGPDGAPASFDVIDSDGRFLGSVAAPRAPIGVFTLRNGRMYCASETADGVPVILVYRIDRRVK